MRSSRTRLDRFLVTRAGVPAGEVRPLLASGRVLVDGAPASGINQRVDEFTRVQLDERVVQDKQPVYLMLHKPRGVVSATRDAKHRTVIDLIEHPDRDSLHIAGRLDYNSTGLLLLTNDGRWSRRLNAPGSAIPKRYRVTLENALTPDYISAFAEGMFFPYEGTTTLPAQLLIIDDYTAEVVLREGKYHQVKRMFGRFRNRVLSLQRTAIGALALDASLSPGGYRELTPQESGDIALSSCHFP